MLVGSARRTSPATSPANPGPQLTTYSNKDDSMPASLPDLRPSQEKVDVQRTTFALDVAARFVCNTITEVEVQQQAKKKGGSAFHQTPAGRLIYTGRQCPANRGGLRRYRHNNCDSALNGRSR